MNRDSIEGRWTQFHGILRERWGRLTADRLSVVAGLHDQLAGKAQAKYGMKKEEARHHLRGFLRSFRRGLKR